jgi:heat shock protein HslJ
MDRFAGFTRRLRALAWVLVLAGLAGGCATTPSRLDGREWRLIAWSISSQRATDFPITARFAEGAVSGRSAVNTYRGSVVPGPGDSIAFGPMATTRMAGPEPAMRAEGNYLQLLASAKAYRVNGNRLTLYGSGRNELLVFEAVPD